MGQSSSPPQGSVLGQCPSYSSQDVMGRSLSPYGNMDEVERSIEKAFLVYQSVKSPGLSVEITKGVVNPSLVSL